MISLVGKVELAGLSDVGMHRTHNEDTIGSDPQLGLAVLADGMGGYKAGEVASAIAVNNPAGPPPAINVDCGPSFVRQLLLGGGAAGARLVVVVTPLDV